MDFMRNRKAGYVPPFDHPSLWTGHSTMVDEIAHQITQPDAVIAAGVEVAKSEIDLPTGVIRSTGEYDIVIELHSDVKANLKLTVYSETEASEDSDE